MAVFIPGKRVGYSSKRLTRFRDFRKSFKMCKMNNICLFCKSCLVLFLSLSWHSDFILHHHRFSDFIVLFLGFLELHLWEPWIQVTMAVLDSYNYLKRTCMCLCNYYESVWTVSKRILQNGSAPKLASCCWLLCIAQTGQLWQGTGFVYDLTGLCAMHLLTVKWSPGSC